MKAQLTNTFGIKKVNPMHWYFVQEGFNGHELPIPISSPVEEAIDYAIRTYDPAAGEHCFVGKPTDLSYLNVIDARSILEVVRRDLSYFLHDGCIDEECDIRMSQMADLEGMIADWLDANCPIKGVILEEETHFRVNDPHSANAMVWEVISL